MMVVLISLLMIVYYSQFFVNMEYNLHKYFQKVSKGEREPEVIYFKNNIFSYHDLSNSLDHYHKYNYFNSPTKLKLSQRHYKEMLRWQDAPEPMQKDIKNKKITLYNNS